MAPSHWPKLTTRALVMTLRVPLSRGECIVQLASLQTAFHTLDEEIKMTSRRVNALEYVLIPRIEDGHRLHDGIQTAHAIVHNLAISFAHFTGIFGIYSFPKLIATSDPSDREDIIHYITQEMDEQARKIVQDCMAYMGQWHFASGGKRRILQSQEGRGEEKSETRFDPSRPYVQNGGSAR
eukprot:Skav217014  [mRNA]  locus=scaffold1803:231140:232860:- [translate_table: standard]